MDSEEANDFVWGRNLVDLLISKRTGDNNFMNLDSNQVDSLERIAANATMWARSRAQNWLYLYRNDKPPVNTLLYPGESPDMKAGNKGVLAVTEISNGPSGDCEYVEMIVAECGKNLDDKVDVSGWIIDDNSGNFNTRGCGIYNISTSIGHYRLTHSPVWENVPVGSIIVLYNHDADCYNLGDNFRIDSTPTGLVYWVPIGGSVLSPYGAPFVERYYTLPNLLQCNYCSNDPLAYATASSWAATIGLNNSADAIQVRCPGCDSLTPGEPAFYHGVGYGPASGVTAFASIASGSNSLGGPVVTGSGSGSKFEFTGSTGADLGTALAWVKTTADAAGSVPATLGSVNTTFMDAVTKKGALGLPCCGRDKKRQASVADNETGSSSDDVNAITVYPNPANTTIYFQFPSSGKVTIRLTDISGRLMSEQVVVGKTTASIDVEIYTPGMYIYQVITNEKTESGKIMIGK